ncbi:MAG: Re/Si-specific NAD(P)(+) transhydrogenase subunit alpha [Luteolibacter sp.]
MTIGVLKEPGYETRVSLPAEAVASLTKKGMTVLVEMDAGERSFNSNADYQKAGAQLKKREDILPVSDIVLTMQSPPLSELAVLDSRVIIGVYQPLSNAALVSELLKYRVTAFSLDMLPRTTRAQSMDVLSSQANIAGYKAVLIAAEKYPRYFPMFMTAAGTIAPAKVLVLGAGVAGLQAIATARRLGAVVEVFDTRPAVKEEVMSLGARFIEVEGAADASRAGGYAVEQSDAYKEQQQRRIAESVQKADIIITTAQIPGRKAPILIPETMLDSMRSGSVIMDLAAATGGNTPVTRNNETILYRGITVVGNSALAATMPSDASKLYGKNILNFLQLLIDKEGKLHLDWNDELVKGSCVTHNGEVMNEKLKTP